MIKPIRWNVDKSQMLRETRGIGFEECALMIEAEDIVDIIKNPSSHHSDQKMFVLEIDGYIHVVPFVENKAEIFLKTVYPSRAHHKIYAGR